MTEHTFAFVFPGQGSQSVGMLSELAQAFPVVQQTFAEASDVLGSDLWALASEGPKETLDQTETTQPAMLAAGIAVWRCWQHQHGPAPVILAGHSLGEYSALVAAGALRFADGVRLVATRARLMQAAVPEGEGAMAAVLGLDDEAVTGLCEVNAEGQVLAPVNFNAPGQVVIAGDRDAVERGVAAAKEAGARRAIVLPVSVPSHCALMRDAAERFGEVLAETGIAPPTIEVLHNVTVEPAQSAESIRDLLVRQLYSPVRWVETIQAMANRGVTLALEAGPGKVLTGLGKRIDKRISTLPVFDTAGLKKALEETRHA